MANTKCKDLSNTLPKGHYMVGGEPFLHFCTKKTGVLLVHGFSSSSHQFKQLAQYLTDRDVTVYAPILAGHSTTPQNLKKTKPKDWVASVEEAMNELSKKVEQIVVVGNSFGGNLAIDLAYRFPKKIKGVVTMGAPMRLRYHTLITLRLYTYGMFQKYYKKREVNYSADYTDFQDEVTYPVIPTKSIRQMLRFMSWVTKRQIPKLQTPILIMAADHDEVTDPMSAQYIHQYVGSKDKKIYWIHTNTHTVSLNHEVRYDLLDRIYQFVIAKAPLK